MPKLKPIVMQMRVSAEDAARIQQAALSDNRTVSAWLRDVALRALDKQALQSKRRVDVARRAHKNPVAVKGGTPTDSERERN